jgi:VanZ family protein
MVFARHSLPAERIELRVPVIAMVLAATAVPIELRLPSYEPFGFAGSSDLITDVLANIIGYVPVGIVLWDRRPMRAVATAAAIAIFAETAQLVMAYRDSSILDALSNIVGAVIGMAIASRWKMRLPALAVSPRRSQIAALMAATIVLAVWMTSAGAQRSRGDIAREVGSSLEAR